MSGISPPALTLTQRLLEAAYPGLYSLGYSAADGTAQFYRKVGQRVSDGCVLLDLGAGRGATLAQLPPAIRQLALFKPHVIRRIGVDVDRAVKENPFLDESHQLIQSDHYVLPLAGSSIDAVLADWVVEHLEDPAAVFREVHRVLKPGGIMAFRTINRWHYIAIGATLLEWWPRCRLSDQILPALQQTRASGDIFQKFYRCNTPRQITAVAKIAGDWEIDLQFIEAEPSYLMSNLPLALLGIAYERLTRWLPLARSTLIVILRKRPTKP